MKRFYLVSACGLFLFMASAHAAGKTTLSRGGLGFIFPDHNSFTNSGQFALDRGMAVEAQYQQTTVAGVTGMVATPSFVFGNGSFGLGVFGSRAGTELTDANANDSIGAGIGFALAKERVTIGVQGIRSLSTTATDDGQIAASITLNGNKRMGFHAGAQVGMLLNSSVTDGQSGTVAMGWGVSEMTKFEAVAAFPDISNFDDFNISGVINLAGKSLFASASYTYAKLSGASSLGGRAGVVFGKFDLSGVVTYPMDSTIADPTFGGTLRVAF